MRAPCAAVRIGGAHFANILNGAIDQVKTVDDALHAFQLVF